MKEVLIINTTRMGDLLQTTPVMAGLKERYPGIRITLLVSSDFAEICKCIPFIDRLFTIDIGDILRKLDRVKLVDCFNYFDKLLQQVNETSYDMVVNFTHSSASAVLTSMIHAREIRGITADEEGHSLKKHPWIKYLFIVIPARNTNPFHLCDMHAKAGGAIPSEKRLRLSVSKEMEDWADALLMQNGAKGDDLVIGFQLGASAEDKRWPIRSFARLADRLAEAFGARILLTGSAKEVDYGKEVEALVKTRPLNLVGKTDLQELSALIKRCDLFISNDSGPLHIATAVGTRTVNISLASVHFRETGPYGDGHYVVKADIPCSPCLFYTECKNTVCKEVIHADNVFELIKLVLSEREIKEIKDSLLWKDIQVYCSYIDEDGLIEYQPLIKRPLRKELFFTHIYRKTWLRVLEGGYAENAKDDIQGIVKDLNKWYDAALKDLPPLFEDEVGALKRLGSLADMGISRVRLIAKEAETSNPDINRIKEIWADVPLIDREIEAVGHTHPPLLPLTTYFRYGKEGLEGRGLAAQCEETCALYGELKGHVTMMLEMFEHIKGGE